MPREVRNRCIYYTSTGNDIDGIDSVDDRDLPDICRAERPPRVLVAGARAKYVLANRRVVKRDSGDIISGAFICLFYMSIILQLAVEIKYKMSYNILIWA